MQIRALTAAALAASVALPPVAGAQTTRDELAALRNELARLSSRIEELEGQLAEQKGRIEETEVRVDTVAAPATLNEDGELVAEPYVSTEKSGWNLTLAARVNQAFLYADQGGDASQGFIVDNDGSGSRIELLAERTWDEYDLASGVELVFSAEVNSSDEIDFGSTDDAADENPDLGDFRQAHWYIESGRYGYFSIGQGDTAAEDTAHVDLSGTSFAGAGSDVDDIAGGLTLFDDFGEATTEVDDFFDMQDGSRSLRVLYKTPAFFGFALKASASNDQQSLEDDDDIDGDGLEPAVGFEYAATFSDIEVEAAGSWRLEDDIESDTNFLVGSASVDVPVTDVSSVNATFAGSIGFQDESDDTTALFGKLGYKHKVFDFGETRVSADIYRGRNEADFAAPNGDLPKAMSYGLFAVQTVDPLSTEFYAGVRIYDVDDVFRGGLEVDVDNLVTFITGARVRF